MFGKLKQALGIGGLKVSIQAPGQISRSDAAITGTVAITAKSDQLVETVAVKFFEEYATGRDDAQKEQQFTLGEQEISGAFEMKAGETKTLDFSLPFQFLNSDNDDLKGKGGVYGAIGKMGKFAANEKSAYKLQALVDVKGTFLDPDATIDIKVIG